MNAVCREDLKLRLCTQRWAGYVLTTVGLELVFVEHFAISAFLAVTF